MREEWDLDPAKNMADIAGFDKWQARKDAFTRGISDDDALNLANFARYHLDPTPELAASVAVSKEQWDNPFFHEIAFEDAKQQGYQGWGKWFPKAKAAVRGAATVVEGVWDESLLTSGGRTAIGVLGEGKDPLEAWRTAGSSDAALAGGALLRGDPVNLGEGFLPQSELAHEQPGFGEAVATETQAGIAQGVDPVEAYDTAMEQEQQTTYGEIGAPITQIGRASRERPKISKVVNGRVYETSWSLGRWAAMKPFDPETIGFNLMSAAIDGTTRVGWDPINVPAMEVTKAFKARNLIIPATVEEAGLTSMWRPHIRPLHADAFLRGKGGRKWMQALADEPGYTRDGAKLLGDIPSESKWAILQETDPAKIEELVRPWLGSTMMKAKPKLHAGYMETLGSVVHDRVISKFVPEDNIASQWGRRVTANSTEARFTPHDPDRSIYTAEQYLDEIGASPEKTDEILSFMAENKARDHSVTQAQAADMVYDEARAKLVRLGYDDADVRELMKQWKDGQVQNQKYLENFVGAPVVAEGGLSYPVTDPRSGKLTWVPVESAQSEAEFASHMIALPSFRDVRRMTSAPRSLRYKIGTHMPNVDPKLRGMASGALTSKLDAFQAIWKNAVLLRGGWPLRVISEELVRMQGAGYTQFMRDPISYFSLAVRNPELVDITDDARLLTEVFEERGGLGATGFQSDIKNQPKIQGPGHDIGRQNWGTVRVTDDAGVVTPLGAEALTNNLIRFRASRMRRVVAERGVDDAVKYFQGPEGKQVLDEILTEAPKDMPRWDLSTEANLRRQLEMLEWEMSVSMGGDGFYIDGAHFELTGERLWLDRNGAAVSDPSRWTQAQRKAYLQGRQSGQGLGAAGIPENLEPIPGRTKATNRQSETKMIREHLGLPDFDELDRAGRQFYTSVESDEGLRRLIAFGDETSPEVVATRVVEPDLTVKQAMEDALAKEQVEKLDVISAKYEGLSDDQLRAKWVELMNSGKIDEAAEFSDAVGRKLDDIPQMSLPGPASGNRFDDAAKSRKGARDFQDWVAKYYDEGTVTAPNKMKTISVSQEKRLAEFSGKVTDSVFNVLMTNPTNKVIRGPFATMRYVEEMAHASVFAGDDAYLFARQWAQKQRLGGMFDDFVAKTLRERGLTKRPKIKPDEAFSWDEVDQWAKTVALEDTKNLFYNIVERGNWADMTRLMFPFADAWQEVILRWSDMLGIKAALGGGFAIGEPGQAIRNWERARQVIEGGRRSGVFTEDRFGNESFVMPSLGMLFPGLEQWRATSGLTDLAFIEPSSIAGGALPGFSPYMQLGASYITPLLDNIPGVGDTIQGAAETAIYGDFPAPERGFEGLKVFLPTVGKRIDAAMRDPKERGQQADNVLQSFMTMMQLRYQGGGAPLTKDEEDAFLKDAQAQGTLVSVLQIFDSMILPAQPRYELGWWAMLEDSGDAPFWLSTDALNNDYAIAREVFGDDELAQGAMIQMYGVDPLRLQSRTQTLVQRPLDESRFKWLEDNPLARQFAPTTLIGLIPVPDSVEFYSQAWNQAVKDETVVYKTARLGAALSNADLGNRRFGNVTEIYDRELADASYQYGVGSEAYNLVKDSLDDWKDKEQISTEMMYFHWGVGGQPSEPNVWGGVTRPTYGTQFDEAMTFVVAGPARDWLMEQNPEMVTFLDKVNMIWETAQSSSLNAGAILGEDYDEDWWMSKDPETLGETLDMKQKIKQWVADGLQHQLNTLELSDDNRLNAEWWVEYVFARMIQGWEADEVLLIVPADVPKRSSQRLGIDVREIIEEIGPAVSDEEAELLSAEEVSGLG